MGEEQIDQDLEFLRARAVQALEEAQADFRREIAAGRVEKDIGSKIRALREERRWSQVDLADRLAELGIEMHQTTVAKMEAGRRPLRVSEALAVATAFEMPLNVLLNLPAPGESETIAEMRSLMREREEALEDAARDLELVVGVAARRYARHAAELHETARQMQARANALHEQTIEEGERGVDPEAS